ncbi:MAG: AAA family ATPase [Ekhidna sp.]
MPSIKNLSELVVKVNKDLGDFCNEFLQERKRLVSNSRTGKKGRLFVFDDSKDRDWSINEGGGTEVQYHLTLKPEEGVIRYGLGFSAQYVPFNNSKPAVDYIKPFTRAFLALGIEKSLPDYKFFYSGKDFISKPIDQGYSLFGHEIDIENEGELFHVNDQHYAQMLDDLRRQFHCYKEIFKERNKMIASESKHISIKNLLGLKPQIILQGPPGTGKTFTAKELAYEIIFDAPLDEKNRKTCMDDLEGSDQFELIQFHPSYSYEDFVRGIQPEVVDGSIAYRTEDKVLVDIANRAYHNFIDSSKNTDELTSEKKTEKQFEMFVEHVQLELEKSGENKALIGDTTTYIMAVEEDAFRYKGDNWNTTYGNRMKFEDLLKLIQQNVQKREEAKDIVGISGLANQHISYFFRVVEWFYQFAKENPLIGEEAWIDQQIERFAKYIQDSIRQGTEANYQTKSNKEILIRFASTTKKRFKFKNVKWSETASGFELSFNDLKKIYKSEANTESEIKKLNFLFPKETNAIYQDLLLFLDLSEDQTAIKVEEKKYVLIIDEINRANLPAVLGELIYGLEYRGDRVQSIYSKDGDRNIVIPPNLLIIGTMNTTDRSVGHIDYAIRRRFAFVDVLPNLEVIKENACEQAEILFSKVRNLFYSEEDNSKRSEYLSPEFRAEEVLIGHSYFLEKDADQLNLRLEYEIKPILKEYVKDGILLESSLNSIHSLHV